MTQRTDREERARTLSAWAESDAAIEALEGSTAPRDTDQGTFALEAFRRAGRPRLDGSQRRSGRSPRRQVRLPDELNAARDCYAVEHGVNPSEVMRQALAQFLSDSSAA